MVSRNFTPPRPSGDGPAAVFMKWVYDQLTQRFTDSKTIKWTATRGGMSAEAIVKGPPLIPFEIYNCPDPADPANAWRTFAVREGYIITNSTAEIPAGCNTPILADASINPFWFVLDIGSMLVDTSATLPTWGTQMIPIGWVDTLTGVGTQQAKIVQFTTGHVFTPCPP